MVKTGPLRCSPRARACDQARCEHLTPPLLDTCRVSKNLDLVRSIYAAWERGDFGSSEWADPEIEYVMVDEPSAESSRGVAAMTQAWRSFLSAWDDYRVQADEYRDLDD